MRAILRTGLAFSGAALAASALAGAPAASILVASDARNPTLRVDAEGVAEVSWRTADGERRYLLIPPTGLVLPGGRLDRPDVSSATAAAPIPFKRVLRRTPDGTLFALQAWPKSSGGPIELRFSRWTGEPTELTVAATCCKQNNETLEGAALFHGKPLFGSSPTPEGKRVRIFVYLDCFACQGSPRSWKRMTGVSTQGPGGTYSYFVPDRSLARRYRAILPGPNLGTTLAPDALAVAKSARP